MTTAFDSMTLQTADQREQRRLLAFHWAELRQAIKALNRSGLYGASAALRVQLNLTFKVWSNHRKGF